MTTTDMAMGTLLNAQYIIPTSADFCAASGFLATADRYIAFTCILFVSVYQSTRFATRGLSGVYVSARAWQGVLVVGGMI